MRKSMSRNPNMLRTMIGMGLTLILILGYAVYSNTLDSEYYGYHTSNEEVSATLQSDNQSLAQWYFTTDSAITWINTTVLNQPADTVLRIEASGAEWYHSPLLGTDDGTYNCKEMSDDYSEVIETCDASPIHVAQLNDVNPMLGLVSLDLPLSGLGHLQADNITEAEELANDLIARNANIVTWKIQLLNSDSQVIDSEGIEISCNYTIHEITNVEEFKLNPVQESIYAFATLVGCFGLLLILPLIAYFAASYKARKDEETRLATPEHEG